MASNYFGKHFRITTWGESHGKAIGVVIDGCPAGIKIDNSIIHKALSLRAPGQAYTSPRVEPDLPEIYSGVFEGVTTGAPIAIIIFNKDFDSSKYEPIKDLLRPGHANYTYINKYGLFDYRGGGRASARETAGRVAAAAVAEQILLQENIKVTAKVDSIAGIKVINDYTTVLKELITKHPEDSFGAVISCTIDNVPLGLGEPIYEKLEAKLAHAMLSIPASKGFAIGSGFASADMLGSNHNDLYNTDMTTKTNNAGGVLAGISNGMPIELSVAFKPTSSIKKPQVTVDTSGVASTLKLPDGSRHDPCVAIRAVPIVAAMAKLVMVDLLLANKLSRL